MFTPDENQNYASQIRSASIENDAKTDMYRVRFADGRCVFITGGKIMVNNLVEEADLLVRIVQIEEGYTLHISGDKGSVTKFLSKHFGLMYIP